MSTALFACDLIGHEISTVNEAGFKGLENGDLLAAAGERFDVLITIDKGIEYQQNMKKLPISILLLRSRSNRLEHLQDFVPADRGH